MADTTKPHRSQTITLNFLKEEGGRPPAMDLYNFLVRSLHLIRDDLVGIDQEFGGNRVHLKLKSFEQMKEEWWWDRASERKMEMECEDGTRRTVYVTFNGEEIIKVKIRNLPFEVSNEHIIDALIGYVAVCDIVEERYGENHVFRSIKTGVRTVIGCIGEPIPSYFEIAGWTAFIEYPGQPRTCAFCDSTEHLRSKCQEKVRRKKIEEREREEETDEEEEADDDSDAAPERRRAESEPPPSLPPLLAATPPVASAPSADDAPPHPSSPPADVTPPADKPPGESEQPASDVTRPAADTPPGDNSQPQQQPVSEQATREEAWDRIKKQARDRSLSRKREASKSPEEEKGVQTRRAKKSTAERKKEKQKKKTAEKNA